MFRITKFLLTSVLFMLNFSIISTVKYDCQLDTDNNEICYIPRLQLTKQDFHIEPVTEHPDTIKEVKLHGHVPILGRGICDSLPNLDTFYADEVAMEEIQEDAFEGCKTLEKIEMTNNNFTKLGRNSLKGLVNLGILNLHGGNIPEIDLDLTSLKNLHTISLTLMNISIFSADTLREQDDLRMLVLCSNNLFDLDVERILSSAPKLEDIYLGENNFKCSRLREMLSVLKARNVRAVTRPFPKERNYCPEKVDGIECLSEEQWEEEVAKLSAELQSLINRKVEVATDRSVELTKEEEETFTGSLAALHKKTQDMIRSQDEIISILEEKLDKVLVILAKKDCDETNSNLGNATTSDESKDIS